MADNVQAELVVTPGATFATDDLSGVHHPYTKIEYGVDGAATPVSAVNPLPVTVGSATVDVSGSAVTVAGVSTAAKQDEQTNLLSTIDVSGMTVAGAVSGTEMQVDVVAALPAGDNNIGNVDVITLPALPAGTNNIGDVDVLSLPALPTGTNSIGTVVDGGSGKTLKRAVVALTADGDVVALVATKRIKVYAFEIQVSADGITVHFRSNNASGAQLGIPWLFNTREGAMGSAVNPPAFIFATVAGEALFAIINGTGTANIAVSYWDDDVA